MTITFAFEKSRQIFTGLFVLMIASTTVRSQATLKADSSKSYLYYAVTNSQVVAQDTVYLRDSVYIYINRNNGKLFFVKFNQPPFPIPPESYNDLSNYIFNNFLANDKFRILERMTSMNGLLKESKIGVDVSVHQSPKSTPIDWLKVKKDSLNAPVQFVLIRSTLGLKSRPDPKMEIHYKGALLAGYPMGLYHNFVLNKKNRPDFLAHTREQAAAFVKAFDKKTILYKPILDVEANKMYGVDIKNVRAEEIVSAVSEFIKIVTGTLKTDVILYTSESFYNTYLRNHFDDQFVWIAKYPTRDELENMKYVPGKSNPFLGISYDFKKQQFNYTLKTKSIGWQFSETGTVAGIYHSVDLNIILNKDYDKWLWKKTQ